MAPRIIGSFKSPVMHPEPEADQVAKFGRHGFRISIAASDDENPACGDAIPGKAEKRVALADAPLRGDIAWRHNNKKGSGPTDCLHDLRGERTVAVEAMVHPDPEILGAQALSDFGIQVTHQIRHPGRLALVVKVSIAYEHVVIVIGNVGRP
jgi:hypothetical protein